MKSKKIKSLAREVKKSNPDLSVDCSGNCLVVDDQRYFVNEDEDGFDLYLVDEAFGIVEEGRFQSVSELVSAISS